MRHLRTAGSARIQRSTNLTATIFLATTLLGACAGGEVSQADFATEFAEASCDRFNTCRDGLGGSREFCVVSLRGPLQYGFIGRLEDAIAAGRVVYDPAAAASCIEAFRGADCDTVFDAPPSCGALLTGTLSVGEACSQPEECQPSDYCSTDSCPSAGVCTARRGAGEECTAGACVEGMVCVDGRCALPPPSSGCSGLGSAPCPASQTCMDNTCVNLASLHTAAIGEACTTEAAAPNCRAGSSCARVDSESYECRASVGSGEGCLFALPAMCPDSEFCLFGGDGLEGVCTTLPADGEPCASGILCSVGSVCVSETCRARKPNGAACSTAIECWTGVCSDGICGTRDVCEPTG